jgi:predicted RNase H-like HicB family nuclease
MKYLIMIEKVNQNYGAYVPDLPGCVASGKTADDTRKALKEAINMHLKGLVADGLPIPQPVIQNDYIESNQPPTPTSQEQSKLRKLFGF